MGKAMWKKVAKVADFEKLGAQRVQTDELDIAVFKQDGQFYAIANVCPHKGASLVEGQVEGFAVTCPWHAWQFNIADGACQNVPGIKQKCYAVKVDGKDVFLDL